MGGGSYNSSSRSSRMSYYASVNGLDSMDDISSSNISKLMANTSDNIKTFGKAVHKDLDPMNVKFRESRDSAEHPLSYAIMLNIDVTGSMGNLPATLIKNGLPTIVSKVYAKGIQDPQIAINAIGDYEARDKAPLQIGQFEINDELLDKTLISINHERGGGGNDGESYLLAWYHAVFHTDIDCFNKRNQKGILVTIGDEASLKLITKECINHLYGYVPERDYSDVELLRLAKEKYNVIHIHCTETMQGASRFNQRYWDNLAQSEGIILKKVDSIDNVPDIIAELASEYYQGNTAAALSNSENYNSTESAKITL